MVGNKKYYSLKSPSGDVYSTDNLSHFCREMGISLSGASKCARGVCTSFWKGWTCKYSISDSNSLTLDNNTPKGRIGVYKYKGTLWFSSKDILNCLGYKRTDFSAIKTRRGSIKPFIDNLKVRYWNSTALLRLKETLVDCKESDWQRMLKILEISKKESVFLIAEDKVLSNPAISKLQNQLLEEQTNNLELKISVKVQESLNSSLQKRLDSLYKITYTDCEELTYKDKYTTLSNLASELNTILVSGSTAIISISNE